MFDRNLLVDLMETICQNVDATDREEQCIFVSTLCVVAECFLAVNGIDAFATLKICSFHFVYNLVQFDRPLEDLFMSNLHCLVNDSLFYTKLNLCILIASASNGIHSLLEAKVFERLCSLSYFSSTLDSESDLLVYRRHLQIVFHLFRILLNGNMEHSAIAAGIVDFLIVNETVLLQSSVVDLMGHNLLGHLTSLVTDVIVGLRHDREHCSINASSVKLVVSGLNKILMSSGLFVTISLIFEFELC